MSDFWWGFGAGAFVALWVVAVVRAYVIVFYLGQENKK